MTSLVRRITGVVEPSVRALASRVATALRAEQGGSVREYWTEYNVTGHHAFTSATESLDYLEWRNDQYVDYARHMPLHGQDGKVVLDYGCGPGHDLVGFGVYSRPRRLIAADVSSSSLAEARARLALHQVPCEWLLLEGAGHTLPLADGSVDLIHCSGVLHHTEHPERILREFRRVLAPGGRVRLMVYNYDSVWLHLLVAYECLVLDRRYEGMDVRQAFARTTDGERCPIARVARPDEVSSAARAAGFEARHLGNAIAIRELERLPLRFAAIADRRLRVESRRFLGGLTFDERGLPYFEGQVAGVDGCYELTPA